MADWIERARLLLGSNRALWERRGSLDPARCSHFASDALDYVSGRKP